MTTIKVKTVLLQRKGRATELHVEGCSLMKPQGKRRITGGQLVNATVDAKFDHLNVCECYRKAVERKRGRSKKNRKQAGEPPKDARYFQVPFKGRMILWVRPSDKRWVGWLVKEDGSFVERRIGKDKWRTFLELSEAQTKGMKRLVLELDTKKLVFPGNAFIMSARDARETGNPSKREKYVKAKRARRTARAAKRNPKPVAKVEPKPEPKAKIKKTKGGPVSTGKVGTGQFIVAEGKSHETGAVTQVLDLRHPDNHEYDYDERWLVRCITHGQIASAIGGKRGAKRMRTSPSEWCKECGA